MLPIVRKDGAIKEAMIDGKIFPNTLPKKIVSRTFVWVKEFRVYILIGEQ